MSGRRIKRPRQRANASPGLVSEPEKEAPLTDTIITNCPGCAALREQLRLLADDNLRLLDLTRSLAARVRLLEDAVARDDKPALIRHHISALSRIVREGE